MARERPDVVCLQEIKATSDQMPIHPLRGGGLLVLLARRQGLLRRRPPRQPDASAPERPVFTPSCLRLRKPHRDRDLGGLTVASVYVPNGGKDFPAKMRFLEALEAFARAHHDAGTDARPLRRPQRRPHRSRRPPEGTQATGHRPAAGRTRAARAHRRRAASSMSGAHSIRTTTGSSPGGRRGGTCGTATSAGASTTCSPAPVSLPALISCPVQKDVGTSDHAPVVATFG